MDLFQANQPIRINRNKRTSVVDHEDTGKVVERAPAHLDSIHGCPAYIVEMDRADGKYAGGCQILMWEDEFNAL